MIEKRIGIKYVIIGAIVFAVVKLLLGAIKAYSSSTGIAVAMGTMSGMVILASKEAYWAGVNEREKG